MRSRGVAKVMLTGVAALVPALALHAQAGELVHQGQWSVDSPQGGCGSMPVLQIKGPGTLFDGSNAAALANLQSALATALARVCPGVSEAILTNGRTRKLVRLNQVAQGDGGAPTTPVTPPDRVPLPRDAAAPSPVRQTSAAPAAPQPVVISADAEAPPRFPVHRSMASLSGVHGTRERCDVLFAWLEAGKTQTPAGRRVNVLPAQMLDIFQDGAMTAVFGKTYDALGNSARIDLYEKTFGACTGSARRTPPQRSPLNNGRPITFGGIQLRVPAITQQQETPLPAEYRQQFAQYSQLLQQAFGGSPGRYEPAVITAYVQQVREAARWANDAVNTAAAAPPTLESFRHMQKSEVEVASKASQLTPADRDQIRLYLHRRETAIAPAIAKSWLAAQGKGAVDLATAKVLVTSRAEVGAVIAALSPGERQQTDATYSAMLDHAVAPSLEAATATLPALPPTWQGAKTFAAKETAFLADYGLFSETPSYTTAVGRIDAARSRIFLAVLPEWRRKVAAAHSPDGELLALREDLRALFVTPADRKLPLYQQFDEPVRQRQDQFDAAVKADEQRRLAAAERAAAEQAARASGEIPAPAAAEPSAVRGAASPEKASLKTAAGTRTGRSAAAATLSGKPEPVVSRAPLHPGDLKAGSGPDAEMLNAIYEGTFDKVQFDRASLDLNAIGDGYIEGFFASCRQQLPPDAVELTVSVCEAGWKDVWGNVTSCSYWKPEGTGVFADPRLHAALNSAPIQQVSSTMRVITNMMTDDNPLAGSVTLALNAVQLKADAGQLVSQTGCTSPALRQFQKNLQRFALGQGGLRLNGTVELGVALLPPAPGTKYRDSNYGQLLDDMVSQQSSTWAMNRYLPGTITTARVEKRDAMGRPASIAAGYAYSSLFAQHQTGSVTLSFEEGRPHCLFFSDQPSVCRTPSNRLSSAYVRGEYR